MIFCTGSFDGTGKEAAVLTKLLNVELKKYFSPIFVTDNRECALEMEKIGLNATYIYDELRKINVENVVAELGLLEKKYEFCAEKVLFGDVDYTYISRKKAFLEMVKYFYFWERILDKEKVEILFGGCVRYVGLISGIVAKKKKTICLGIASTPFVDTFCLTGDNYGKYTLLEYYYAQKKITLIPKEEEDVSRLLASCNKEINSITLQEEYKPALNFNKIKYLIDRVKVSRIEKDSPYLRVGRGINKYLLRLLRQHLFTKGFYKLPETENFFYYPLQIEDDSNRLVWADFIESQISVIKSISRSLPAGCCLYVKEHPAAIGQIPISELRNIKKVSKVRLISPFVPGKYLIKKSVGLITLTGTSGMEALVLKTPVIVLGRGFYNFPELVHIITDWRDLDAILHQVYYLRTLPKEKDVLRLLQAYRKSCYKGSICMRQYYHSNVVDNSNILNQENAKNLAEGIYQSYLISLKIRRRI